MMGGRERKQHIGDGMTEGEYVDLVVGCLSLGISDLGWIVAYLRRCGVRPPAMTNEQCIEAARVTPFPASAWRRCCPIPDEVRATVGRARRRSAGDLVVEAHEDLREALRGLFLEVCRAFRIDRLVAWLGKKLGSGRR